MNSDKVYSDSLDQHFSTAFLHSFFVTNLGPYESIKSKGIDVITNISLRNQVIDLYEGRYVEYRFAEKELIDFINRFKQNDAKKYFRQFTLFDG